MLFCGKKDRDRHQFLFVTLNPEPRTLNRKCLTLLAGGLIVLAALTAYHNSFFGPFILDDNLAITANPSIRHFGSALSPPADSTAGGRPLLNLTFAINYALGGLNVWGYHAFNLLVHTLAGLTLFGVVRRTLLKCGRGALTPPTVLALAVAVIWVVHPLQTEAVTYISQRAESLMGLFYLLTLYCFVRSTDETGERQQARGDRPEKKTRDTEVIRPPASSLWPLASCLFCFLGMATKEVMVSAPLMVLLYDRTFIAGSFREAWRLRWRYYLGLACTWLLLARLMTSLGQRGVGFDQKVSWWSYALTSCRSVVLYLKLAVWPHPLVFDYGTQMVQHAADVIPYALVLALLLLATLLALRHRPVIGFAGVWFFVILAPASSVIPVAHQPMAEHRVYLSLAAVVVLVVLGLYRLAGRHSLMVCAAAAAGLGWLTVQRNQDYKSELTIWRDTVAKCPDNERAHNNLGEFLLDESEQLPDATAEFQAALKINPDYAEAHYNLGIALYKAGQISDAIAQYEEALRIKPDYAEAHHNLGLVFSQDPGRLPDAIAEYQAALRIRPDDANTHNSLGTALAQQGNLPGALEQFGETVQIAPEFAQAHYNFGNALAQSGRLPEAIDQYELALRLKPDFTAARNNLDLARNAVTQPTNK